MTREELGAGLHRLYQAGVLKDVVSAAFRTRWRRDVTLAILIDCLDVYEATCDRDTHPLEPEPDES